MYTAHTLTLFTFAGRIASFHLRYEEKKFYLFKMFVFILTLT